MTLLVGIKVPFDKILNPYRKPNVFSESALLIAADTRFSFLDNDGVVDEGIKIWPLNHKAIAGFSGDVLLGEVTLITISKMLEKRKFKDPNKIASCTQKWLLQCSRVLKTNLERNPTSILLCIYDSRIHRFFMYQLSDHNNFDPELRDGLIPLGSGADAFEQSFSKILDHYINNWTKSVTVGGLKQVGPSVDYEPLKPGEVDPIQVRDIAFPLIDTLDSIINDADIKTVGGLIQIFLLTEKGLNQVRSRKRNDDGTWVELATNDLKGWLDMLQKRVGIPDLEGDCSIKE